MQGTGLNLKDHIVKTVAYYVKRSLEPQLAELAAYRELAAIQASDKKIPAVLLRVCEGCKMPYDEYNKEIFGTTSHCGNCSKTVKCGQCESKPPECQRCSRYMCKRHANRMIFVQCCHRSICKHCVTSCSGCAVDICQDCICCVQNDILEYCEGCCNCDDESELKKL